MKENIKNHPAIKLGQFIKDHRIKRELTLRDASKALNCNVSDLSNVERGVGDHINESLFYSLISLYEIKETELFKHLYLTFKSSSVLKISDIFSREEVLPAFKILSPEQTQAFLETLGFEDNPSS